MLFTTPAFLLFFIVLWGFWYLLPRYRKLVLLGGSLVFVMSISWLSGVVCLVAASGNFYAGLKTGSRQKTGLYRLMQSVNIGIIPASGLLSAHALFFNPGHDPISGLLLVAGLSFYSIQHFAYLSDVYNGRLPAEKNLSSFLLGSFYFPKFICGPIVMYRDMKQQIADQPVARVSPFPGLYRVLLGYFKKMVIADALAPSVSSVFDYQDHLPGLTILAAAFLFTIQLYFDFSGYCDIALGCSLLLGITLPENFWFPLRASSMTDFWRRWHVTLLRFFTDYLFMPLTFRLRKLGRHAAAAGIIVVFLASALWHGWGITFLLWGLCHTAYMLTEHYVKIPLTHDRPVIRVIREFMVVLLFSFSNIFFRSPDASSCGQLFSALFSPGNFFPVEWAGDFVAPLAVGGHQADLFNFYVLILLIFGFLFFEKKIFVLAGESRWKPIEAFCAILIILLFGVFASTHRFIYMQF